MGSCGQTLQVVREGLADPDIAVEQQAFLMHGRSPLKVTAEQGRPPQFEEAGRGGSSRPQLPEDRQALLEGRPCPLVITQGVRRNGEA